MFNFDRENQGNFANWFRNIDKTLSIIILILFFLGLFFFYLPFYPNKFAVPPSVLVVVGYFPSLKGIKFNFSTLDK